MIPRAGIDAVGPALDRDNPWPGLASYHEEAHDYFSGRSAEIAELLRRAVDEPVTVLLGKSGLGKTSLLRAGLFPRLRERGFLPVYVRLRFDAGAGSLMSQVAATLFEALEAGRIEHPTPRSDESLWEYLHRDGLAFWAPGIQPARPVLVLDQFEEVFTVGRSTPAQVAAFREELADLAENRIPAALAERLDEVGDAAPAPALDVLARSCRLIVSLREDFLPELEGWLPVLPSLRRNRMRLLPMGPAQALQAVFNERTRHLVDEPLAHQIVSFLCGDDGGTGPVEPALLSLVCRGINEARKRARKTGFDEGLIEANKRRIVADFYAESLADQPPRVRFFIEDELVTDQGFRDSFAAVAATERGCITHAEIATLVGRRLLRVEYQLGAERIELTHDLLAPAALDGRLRRAEAQRMADQQRWRRKVSAIALAIFLVPLGLTWWWYDRAETKLIRAQEKEQYNEALAEAVNQQAVMRSEADQARVRAHSREIAARAGSQIEQDRELAVLLAAEALHIGDTVEARQKLFEAMRYAWPGAMLQRDMLGASAKYIAMDSAAMRLAVLAVDGTLSTWDLRLRLPSPLGRRKAEWAGASGLAFGPGGRQLYVSGDGFVDGLDAASLDQERRFGLPLFDGKPEAAAQLALSADGRWLAALGAGSRRLLVRELQGGSGEWVSTLDSNVSSFALSRNGERIAAVVGRGIVLGRLNAIVGPLTATVLERDGRGHWASFEVLNESCGRSNSISASSDYMISTSKAASCTSPLKRGAKARERPEEEGREIRDSLASPHGQAFVWLLTNGVLKIIRGNPASRSPETDSPEIRGIFRLVAPYGGNMRGSYALDEAGTRLAVRGRNGDVRIYAVGGERLLLTEQPRRRFAVTPDGKWVAHLSSTASPDPLMPGGELRIVPVGQALAGQEFPANLWRKPVPTMPTELFASQDAIVAVFEQRSRSSLKRYDIGSGESREIALPGRFLGTLGAERALVLVRASSSHVIVRARDGVRVAPWEEPGSGPRRVEIKSLPSSSAVRVTLVTGPGATERETHDYIVRDEVLEPTGELTEPRPGHEIKARSIGGRYVVRRLDDAVDQLFDSGSDQLLFSFRGAGRSYWFSADESLLAYARNGKMEVLELPTMQRKHGPLDLRASAVRFLAGNELLAVELASRKEMLLPIGIDAMRSFARWLVPRSLSAEERCEHGIDATPACSAVDVMDATPK